MLLIFSQKQNLVEIKMRHDVTVEPFTFRHTQQMVTSRNMGGNLNSQ